MSKSEEATYVDHSESLRDVLWELREIEIPELTSEDYSIDDSGRVVVSTESDWWETWQEILEIHEEFSDYHEINEDEGLREDLSEGNRYVEVSSFAPSSEKRVFKVNTKLMDSGEIDIRARYKDPETDRNHVLFNGNITQYDNEAARRIEAIVFGLHGINPEVERLVSDTLLDRNEAMVYAMKTNNFDLHDISVGLSLPADKVKEYLEEANEKIENAEDLRSRAKKTCDLHKIEIQDSDSDS